MYLKYQFENVNGKYGYQIIDPKDVLFINELEDGSVEFKIKEVDEVFTADGYSTVDAKYLQSKKKIYETHDYRSNTTRLKKPIKESGISNEDMKKITRGMVTGGSNLLKALSIIRLL